LTYSAADLPAGLAIDPSTGAITGTPTTAGVTTTAIKVGDGTYSAQDLLTWTVTPHIAVTVPANQTSAVGDAVSVSVSATDVGSATLSYSATGLPTGLSIDSGTGVISGTLGSGSAGKYQVVVTASNGTDSDSAAFFWQVGQVVIANPGSQINMTGDAVSLTLTAHESGSPTLTTRRRACLRGWRSPAAASSPARSRPPAARSPWSRSLTARTAPARPSPGR
jgi:hypothetical protein